MEEDNRNSQNSISTDDSTSNEEDVDKNMLPVFNMTEPNDDDPIMKWAAESIGEDPDTKVALIEDLRDMIFARGECEPHRTDDAFLIRFLRARHFIVRMAHRLMVNYYIFKETHPELFYNIDYNKLLELGESEIFSIPPYVDQHGRRMLIVRFGNWSTSQFTPDELFQSLIFLIQAAVVEPRYQILGGVCILDVGTLGAGHAWYLTPSIIRQIMAMAYSSLPHRVQAVHIINVSKIFDYAFSMIKPFLLDIMKERIFIHSDLESLHKHISPKYLPRRFGGVHKDYAFNDWLTLLRDNDEFLDEMTSCGYEGCREFVKKL